MRQIAKIKKVFFIVFMGAFFISVVLTGMALVDKPALIGKLSTTSGLLLSAAALIQLEISGLFEKGFSFYADIEKYPYGPPSHFTRDLVEVLDPDKPVRTFLKTMFFLKPVTGFWMLMLSILFEMIGAWA